MTWRAIWTPPGTPFPEHSDHETEAEAHAAALRVSRQERVEVAVVPLHEGVTADCAASEGCAGMDRRFDPLGPQIGAERLVSEGERE